MKWEKRAGWAVKSARWTEMKSGKVDSKHVLSTNMVNAMNFDRKLVALGCGSVARV